MLNAVEPGTMVPIHRHQTRDESFVVLRGKLRSTTYNDDGSVLESVVLCQDEGLYGGDIPKGVWRKLESLEMGWGGIIKGGHSVAFFRCKINRIDISLAFGCKNRDQRPSLN